MTNLFISLYPEKNKVRQLELAECLKRNCKVFDRVWVLAEHDEENFDYLPDISPATVNILPVSVRPTFRTFFSAINTVCGLEDVNLIANSDIYFEEIPVWPQASQCFALTRYEVEANGSKRFLNRNDSQDVWIFHGKIRPVGFCDFHLGIRGCDNRINRELAVAGYNVINPSLTIKAYHLHRNPTDHHSTNKVINPPYLRLNPTAI